ncbi:hypothetical protein [Bosea sp. ANAM02]|uniref:hypothetical protein n=1 Tax=Bosea sp. ANAM02 TaxID=2020412 RepID=UPI00140EBD02|nr:hypothetical protein [Bosea sp. ANAM02]BCB17134.1 hypothetical protein OCUBac02_00280 [Bosea sp. ANAM02]
MVARRSIGRGLTAIALTSVSILPLLWGQANAQMVKIVGIGASSCQYFARETNGKPEVEKNFFAWAQGYMSGLLLRAPPGKDEDLDLEPALLPLLKQAEFLRNFCDRNPDADFSDGVIELYKTLRAPPS